MGHTTAATAWMFLGYTVAVDTVCAFINLLGTLFVICDLAAGSMHRLQTHGLNALPSQTRALDGFQAHAVMKGSKGT